MKPPSLTIGIEEEYQVIDPQTRELKSYITQILEDSKLILREQVKAELHQSMVEVGTEVCNTPAEARAELVRLRREIINLAGRNGLKIAAAGTHPFSSWVTQEITPFERYLGVEQDMQDLAQQLLIFGTHVHVAIEDRDFLIDAMNVSRYFAPHVLCLSTSSPFWTGRQTGLKSYRSIIFRHFPRSGIPPLFDSWAALNGLVETLVRTSASTRYWSCAHDSNHGGVPVRGKLRKMMLRYDFSPVLRPIQNGELCARHMTCGTKYRATFMASMRNSRSSMPMWTWVPKMSSCWARSCMSCLTPR